MKLIAQYGNAGCGIRDETGTRKGFNLIGFNYLTRFEVNILFMVNATGSTRGYSTPLEFFSSPYFKGTG
ncbi:MAG: hypothetical protein A2W95_04880 [Bacteroidetes bacterium GWA2_40_14]|jgi:hypothetical protein|nr:MAG: hypothetical protein A2W95_04880 [Bacteroidetes bacterium GWA2_40_14]